MFSPSATGKHRASRLLLILLVLPTLPPAPAQAEELGRLFFTPERRHSLDRQRQSNLQQRQPIAEEDPTLTVNGIVRRSDGKRTFWINGIAQDDTAGELRVITDRRHPEKLRLQSADLPAAELKIGDTINRHTGESTALLGGGKIVVRTPDNTARRK